MTEKISEELPFCECGCGKRVTKKGNRFIHNHNWTGRDSTYRNAQAKKRVQYFKDNPEKGKEHSKLMVRLHSDHPEWGVQQSIRVKKRFNDSEERKKSSDKMIQFYKNNPELREELSKIKHQLYKLHPEIIKLMSESTIQFYIDHPEACEEASIKSIEQFSIQENRERMSAIKMGQDYDDGKWTGFAAGDRGHVKLNNFCIKLNNKFKNSHAHHILPNTIIYIPAKLHNHISHNMKTGEGMDVINALAFQYLNGYYNG